MDELQNAISQMESACKAVEDMEAQLLKLECDLKRMREVKKVFVNAVIRENKLLEVVTNE